MMKYILVKILKSINNDTNIKLGYWRNAAFYPVCCGHLTSKMNVNKQILFTTIYLTDVIQNNTYFYTLYIYKLSFRLLIFRKNDPLVI